MESLLGPDHGLNMVEVDRQCRRGLDERLDKEVHIRLLGCFLDCSQESPCCRQFDNSKKLDEDGRGVKWHQVQDELFREVDVDIESPDEPLEAFVKRSQQEVGSGQPDEGLECLVESFILILGLGVSIDGFGLIGE